MVSVPILTDLTGYPSIARLTQRKTTIYNGQVRVASFIPSVEYATSSETSLSLRLVKLSVPFIVRVCLCECLGNARVWRSPWIFGASCFQLSPFCFRLSPSGWVIPRQSGLIFFCCIIANLHLIRRPCFPWSFIVQYREAVQCLHLWEHIQQLP